MGSCASSDGPMPTTRRVRAGVLGSARLVQALSTAADRQQRTGVGPSPSASTDLSGSGLLSNDSLRRPRAVRFVADGELPTSNHIDVPAASQDVNGTNVP
eukprot:CAMPEP_0174829820 /NCGR_PEP_ID=MMETSP1114-20130205/2168_1 /TAXON_ID=312471 /ORGANISM="Neobodo designis, Strain CCAP 1951/1" /LENGTH=99 /DNA_ID=CAMNT_0016063585 /DNA_START=60 /DNA_END=360 /DNA_ORIENTATION=+